MEFYPKNSEINCRKIYYSSNAFEEEDFEYYIKGVKRLYTPKYDTGQADQREEKSNQKSNKGITNRLTWPLGIHDVIFSSLKEKLITHINLANQFWGFDLINLSDTIYMEYTTENDTFLDWHMDLHTEYPYNNRKISFSIPFNCPSEYKGGDLEFFVDSSGNPPVFRPELGSIVAFPSFLMHKVSQVTEGTRKVLVGFIGGPPLR